MHNPQQFFSPHYWNDPPDTSLSVVLGICDAAMHRSGAVTPDEVDFEGMDAWSAQHEPCFAPLPPVLLLDQLADSLTDEAIEAIDEARRLS